MRKCLIRYCDGQDVIDRICTRQVSYIISLDIVNNEKLKSICCLMYPNEDARAEERYYNEIIINWNYIKRIIICHSSLNCIECLD
jgi:hypothetical protein